MLMADNMQIFQTIQEELRALAVSGKAESMQRFFKTGKGEYGEGDFFIGVSVPHQRLVAKSYCDDASTKDITALLDSKYHEERLTGVLILVMKYKKDKRKNIHEKWVNLFLNKTNRINNWDLVDSSAHLILGDWLEQRDRKLLYEMAKRDAFWENRIAIVSTLHFIRKNDITDAMEITKILMHHSHDLIHKACGWMLREAWQKQPESITLFLDKFAVKMPRTMLRYTIEKMDEHTRQYYLKLK
jgi:3-methyladenine DNA glycosylase AlkD